MNIGIISDIHSNFFALNSVLESLSNKIDLLICAGDFVGYGPQPIECLNSLMDFPSPHYYVLGNHDLGVRYEYAQKNDISGNEEDKQILAYYNIQSAAKTMFEKNSLELSEEHYKFLTKLPEKQVFDVAGKSIYLTHGTPSKNQRESVCKYLPAPPIQPVRNTVDRADQFKRTKKIDIIIVGHTHQRFFINRDRINGWSQIGDRYQNKEVNYPKNFAFPRNRIIINPGAIGQPRDGNSAASYMIINLDEMVLSFYTSIYPRKPFYELVRKKCDPLIHDETFWEITF
jgi:predicted phosphodiesterase